MRSTSWCGDCSRSLPAAGAVFVSLSTFSKHLFVQIDTYLVRSNLTNCHVRTRVGEHVGCCPSDLGVRPRMESRMIFLFFLCHIYFLFFVPECEICTVVMIEASSEQSKSLFYMHTYCCRCWCSVLLLLFLFCYVETVCGFTTEYLDLLDINSYYIVRCWMTYEYAFVYTHHVLLLPLLLLSVVCCYTVVAAAAAACCCCSSTFAGWQSLLPLLIASDSIVFFVFVQTRFIFNVPLAVLLCRSYSFDFLPTV